MPSSVSRTRNRRYRARAAPACHRAFPSVAPSTDPGTARLLGLRTAHSLRPTPAAARAVPLRWPVDSSPRGVDALRRTVRESASTPSLPRHRLRPHLPQTPTTLILLGTLMVCGIRIRLLLESIVSSSEAGESLRTAQQVTAFPFSAGAPSTLIRPIKKQIRDKAKHHCAHRHPHVPSVNTGHDTRPDGYKRESKAGMQPRSRRTGRNCP